MVHLNKGLLTKNFLSFSFLFCLSGCSVHDPPVPLPHRLWQQHLVTGCHSQSHFHWRRAAWTHSDQHLCGHWLWHQHRAEPVTNSTPRPGVLLKALLLVLLFTHIITGEPEATSYICESSVSISLCFEWMMCMNYYYLTFLIVSILCFFILKNK